MHVRSSCRRPTSCTSGQSAAGSTKVLQRRFTQRRTLYTTSVSAAACANEQGEGLAGGAAGDPAARGGRLGLNVFDEEQSRCPTPPGSDRTSRTIRIEEPSMPKGIARTLSAEKLRDLARAGAEVALKRLRAEIIAIERAFPELALPKKRRALTRTLKQATNRTSRMSAAARKAVSVRMKRYWAERRKARARVK